MPDDKLVKHCVQSVLKNNPEMDESTAWAICNKLKNQNKLGENGEPLSTADVVLARIELMQEKVEAELDKQRGSNK